MMGVYMPCGSCRGAMTVDILSVLEARCCKGMVDSVLFVGAVNISGEGRRPFILVHPAHHLAAVQSFISSITPGVLGFHDYRDTI